jgi:CheY-like chemotaxis protein
MDDPERRRTARAAPKITAVLFRGGSAVGRYLVQNLSAGGVLLTGRRSVDLDDHVRVVLPFPGRDAVVVEGRVTRCASAGNGIAAVAVELRHRSPVTEDAIQQAMLDAILADDRRVRPAVLLVEDCEDVCERITAGLVAAGRRVVTAATPLAAVQHLEDPTENIDTAFVDVSVGEADGLELVVFIRDEHPDIRRVLVQGTVRPSAAELMRSSELVHAVLDQGWDQDALSRALSP